ncbi:MAG: YifB family Mg chelatase-like AAA ATPase [Bacteroidales bacterium]|nr:YifB family Mg chelatase-like AAA ATPase [Bacteroidales bacterium]
MLTHIHGAKCIGIDAVEVTVEIDIDRGIGIHLVGLADVAVKESLLRTTTALEALGFRIPGKRIVINLAPADLRKNGSGYDLPIAVGIIAASLQRELPLSERYILMGELGLDGSVRAIPGALPFAVMAQQAGYDGIILPVESALEAVEFKEMKVYGASSLADVVRILEGQEDCRDLLIWNTIRYRQLRRTHPGSGPAQEGVDFADIIGQEGAKRGIEIAAAGSHNIIMVGAPGAGKSSLAKAMAGILPPMTMEEALVTSKIYSVAGKANLQDGLIRRRPFRAPHYSASLAAIIGGGGGDNILPGEVSLANNGVLFLDEVGQMPKAVIEALRGPIEDRTVSISRLKAKVSFPASFMLIAASNPCPCGYYGEGDRCTCTPTQRQNYLAKLSGPILDRIDLHVWMHPVPADRIVRAGKAESSEAVAGRVLRAREIQKERFAGERDCCTNAEMSMKVLERHCPLCEECRKTMENLMARMGFSMRAYFRIIKVARTIADLEGTPDIRPAHLLEAASYRFLDRRNLDTLL